MPKETKRRIIDSRTGTRATTITGVTITAPATGNDHGLLLGLTDDDHTQYLLADGTRSLSGNLTVGSGVTIDGVDISAHAANASAHHAPVTAGTLISLSTQQVSLASGSAQYQVPVSGASPSYTPAWTALSGMAGSGLTFSSGAFAVGAGNGLTVAADSIALTTPGSLTVSTTNSAAGSHTHAVTSSSNPGAAASILASTASGGLTLQSLAVRGSVDITDGGDLTVTGSGAYAGSQVLFADSSGGNVGIMGAPDSQFALDIVGPCRATWFVGPHAIQLKDVLILSHFDGRQPFETNYAGEPNGHMGQVATVAGGLIYRPGKFGTKAAQFDIGTQYNYVTNPSFETGTTSWGAIGGATLVGTSTVGAVYGTLACRITFPGSTADGMYYQHVTSTAGTYTASAFVRSYSDTDVGDNVSIYMRFVYTDATSTDTTVTTHTITDDWVRISNTATTNGAKTLSYILLYIRDTLSGAAHYVMVDGVQLEVASYATSYIDGSLGSGHVWTGTAHASTSYRVTSQMTYPTAGNIDETGGTIMAWVRLNRSAATQTIVRMTGTTAGNIFLAIVSGNLVGYWGTAGITGSAVSALEWHHVTMTYSGTTLTLYLDGVAVGTGTSSGFVGMPTNMSVGGNGTSDLLVGLIDDFVITETAMAADGIRAVYESDAPVFAESSRFSFRATPQGLVWADDEGLWMRNAAGSAVLGAYGGAATKSWAGVTLAPSDIVIGDASRGGYVQWDDSASTLSVYGTVTALAGAIGGWTIATGRLVLDTGTAATSAGLSPADYPFYAGQTYANRALAPFYVTPAGALKATNADIAGKITASSGSFTGALTLGASGGIYQGTGTFASPTAGLKIYNSSDIGQVAVYSSSVKTLRLSSDDLRLKMASSQGGYRSIRWLPDIDGTDTASTSQDYRADINAWGWNNGVSDIADFSLSAQVNAGDYDTRRARTSINASNFNGSTYNTTSIFVEQGHSAESYRRKITFYTDYLIVQRYASTPSETPSSGYAIIWLDTATNRLYMKDSGGTSRYVTFA